MIKVRNAGAWQDVTLYKARVAGAWEDVLLGKRWSLTDYGVDGTPLSIMEFTSGTAASWETLITSASTAAGTMSFTTDHVVPSVGGSHAIASIDAGLHTVDKFYVEFDIEFTDAGSGGLPAFGAVGTDGANVDGLFILEPNGDAYRFVFKDVSSEGTIAGPSTIALNSRVVIRFDVNLFTEYVELFYDGVGTGPQSIAFMGALNEYNIAQFLVGDIEENYGANKFKIYRTEYGTHTDIIGP